MKNSKVFALLLVLLAPFFMACSSQEAPAVQAQDMPNKDVAMPQKPKVSMDTFNARINQEIGNGISTAQKEIAEEAFATIDETYSIIKMLDAGKSKEAEQSLYALIGKMETLVAADPELSLTPVGIDVRTEGTISDINSIKAITKAAKAAVKKGYYQEARSLLNDLSSEEIVSTYYIPLATYPDGLRQAALEVKSGKLDMAKGTLLTLLNAVVIEENVLPIPVLVAEQFVMEAATMDMGKKEDRDEMLVLLENADYNLKLAEALGYGKRNSDFKDLAKSIKTLKADINRKATKEEIKKSFDSLKSDMQNFRKKYFSRKHKK